MHDWIGAVAATIGDSQMSIAVDGSGILEKANTKRNRKVFHKSLSLLWIANVERC
jgi:hypothetical protein